MTPDLEQKLGNLRKIIRHCGSALVAYSGGVDSALVLFVAHQELGDRALGCIGLSPSYPRREMQDAISLAESLGAPCRIVNTREYADANYAANPANRCYYCKSELCNHLRAIASQEGWNTILDGNHLDDIGDHINGMAAARERGVRSPLIEAGITKSGVRALARELGLSVWDKPAMACLSSRVPTGTAITPALLEQIESAEDVLAGLGFRQFRVRHHGDVARIELPVADLARAVEYNAQILAGVRRAGYRFVTLDLAGFRPEDTAAGGNSSPVHVSIAGQAVASRQTHGPMD
jgi:pyridinium-3,5-biscarboxylic acid mononucleotide sulfurtransferase